MESPTLQKQPQGEGRKRSRFSVVTPALVNDDSPRPRKKLCKFDSPTEHTAEPNLLSSLPDEVVGHVLSFCVGIEDRFSLQTTSRDFRRISNSHQMTQNLQLGGDLSGNGGIIQDEDTPVSAIKKLTPFAKAGNLEAVYMLGMVKSYCHEEVHVGINLLQHAAAEGYVRASYTLGLILRDWLPDEASNYMKDAASNGYLPALQEVLPASEMKSKYGDPCAGELAEFLDPVCLNRLLGRHYVQCPHLREVNTSHCWNPLCGRWAFKAQSLRQVIKYNSRVSRMKMCSRCCRAKYCSKLCQVHDWRSGRHKMECPFL